MQYTTMKTTTTINDNNNIDNGLQKTMCLWVDVSETSDWFIEFVEKLNFPVKNPILNSKKNDKMKSTKNVEKYLQISLYFLTWIIK